jgi:hypothetical protein
MRRRAARCLMAGTFGVLSLLLISSVSPAQDAPDATTVQAAGAEAGAGDSNEPESRSRLRLLREGSTLLRVVGRLHRDESTGAWRFTIDPDEPYAPRHELTVMPCALLTEMQRMVESAPNAQLVFEMTGEVYVYRLRNYLLPTHPPLLIGRERVSSPPESGSDTGEAESEVSGAVHAGEKVSADDEESETDRESGRRAQDIIRDLERSVAPIAPRPAPQRDATTTTVDDAASEGRKLLREGTKILARRGQIRRAADGALVFIFDSDAEGLADPPMTLMPCLLLERIDNYVTRSGEEPTPVLISGTVAIYEGRNYLLPSMYRIPYHRTLLHP